jgi:Mg/Co/Ni transporter MgtE
LVEQLVLNMIDMMSAKYGLRPVVVSNPDGTRQVVEFDFSQLKDMDLKTSIDIGESSYYSAIAVEQTLDNLLTNGFIEFIDYLERMPEERIPRKAELITKLKEAQQGMQKDAQYEEMAKFLESLPPQTQQQILALPPEQQEQAVMQMMQQQVA